METDLTKPPTEGHMIHAEREWIRQMFAGTVHNIGNVITVAKLAASELKESNEEKRELIDVILNDMLPTMEEHVEAGTIGEFLNHDEAGSQFMASLRTLLEHKKTILDDQHETLSSLDSKFDHVTEIINLQQRLIRGTGHCEYVHCKSLVDDAIKMMCDSAVRHQVDVNFTSIADVTIAVDPSMVTQVFINLIKNAIEALDRVFDRERKISITMVRCKREYKEHIVITFEDNGPGIPEANLPKIFDFGFSTKNPGDYNRGVGLSYCKGAIDKFDGNIDVMSSPDGGTRIAVEFPIEEPSG